MKGQGKFLLPVWLLLLLSGCLSPSLERQSVPIHWGIRLDHSTSPFELHDNFEQLSEGDALLVEIPLHADSAGLPVISIPSSIFQDLAGMAAKKQVDLSLALSTSHPRELFPEEVKWEVGQWFEAYRLELNGLLQAFDSHPPKRLILGNDWSNVEIEAEAWTELMADLRKRHPELRLGYGKLGGEAHPTWWNACDFLAVEYPALADPNPKPRAMKLNPNIGETALSLDKPILIYRANLMGPYKTISLKNQLRFWQEEVKLEGLFINSLYARIPPLDSTSYFGLQEAPDLLEFIRDYRE